MTKKRRKERKQPLTLEEKLGHIWGIVFLATVFILTATIVGRGCFFPD